jgi:hypothetical protein
MLLSSLLLLCCHVAVAAALAVAAAEALWYALSDAACRTCTSKAGSCCSADTAEAAVLQVLRQKKHTQG